jgi:hypothetical protein
MNLKILQWLIQHRELLLQVVSVGKRFSKDMTLLEKWVLVDEIARLVLPVVESNDEVMELLASDYWAADDDAEVSFAMGADVAALGVDWRLVVEVLLPVVISILEAMACNKK